MGKITQTKPMQVEEVTVQEINGIVKKLEQTNTSNVLVTFTLREHPDTPITVQFPYAHHDTQSPIKVGDWLTVTTKVERLSP
jgi:hypothetical protein